MKKAIVLFALILMTTLSFAQSVIINEWTQGGSGSKEWVELLVVQTTNMQNWRLTDNYTSSATSAAYVQFSDAMFASVPAGTIIVVYNAGEIDVPLGVPPEDVDWTTDNKVVLAHNGTKVTNGGSWISFNNGNSTSFAAGDAPMLKDAAGVVIHDWDQGDNAGFLAKKPLGGTTNTKATHYIGNTAAGVADTANWYTVPVALDYASNVTPGQGNGGLNTAWIASLRGGTLPASINSVNNAGLSHPTPNSAVTITADVSGTSNATVNIQYRTGGTGTYTAVAMTNTTGTTWTGNIPGQVEGTLVEYYVDATNQGASTVRLPSSDYRYRVLATPLTNTRLVVNEVMYYRTEPASHAHDWVELYNNTAETIDLSYFQFSDNAVRSYTLPAGTTIAAGGYYILPYTTSTFIADYPDVSTTIVGPSFTFELSMPTDSIRIYDLSGNEINAVGYTNASPWPIATAGYSIMLDNPSHDNSLGANWLISGTLYGTPGATNGGSDVTPPILSSVASSGRYVAIAHFNEPLETASANLRTNYSIFGLTIDSVRLAANLMDVSVYLNPSTPMVSTVEYTLSVSNLADASNNVAGTLTGVFSWTATPLPVMMIDEINYHPSHRTSSEQLLEWFEAVNTTSSAINLNGWHVTINWSTSSVADTIIGTDLIVQPGQYVVFANYPDSLSGFMGITANYGYPRTGSLSNSTARMTLTNSSGTIIDSLSYAVSGLWPLNANTLGKSIYLPDLNADRRVGTSWSISNVQMINGDYGTPGMPSSGFSSAPIQMGPSMNATVVPNNATFEWVADPLAATYHLQVASDSLFTTVDNSVITTTSYTFTTLVPGVRYFWRVRSIKNSVPSVWSTEWPVNANYSIASVTSPAFGNDWVVGTTHNVTWIDNGMTVANGFYSVDNGANWTQIFGPIANTGTYPWSLPFTPSTTCKVKITSGTGAEAVSNTFTISDYQVTVTSPTNTSFWMVGSVHNITWTDNGMDLVNLYWSDDNGTNWHSIVSDLPNTNTYAWTVPLNTTAFEWQVLYLTIKVESPLTSAYGVSPSFMVQNINFTSATFPAATDTLFPGSVQHITWTDDGCAQVAMYYMTDEAGASWNQIFDFTTNTHSYDWTVPEWVSNHHVSLKLVSDNHSVIYGGGFYVTLHTLALTSPVGGENWNIGSTHNITWTDNGIAQVNGAYSTDGGMSWNHLFGPIANTHSFEWTIPNTPSTNCKVIVGDMDSPVDVISNVFTISIAGPPPDPTDLAITLSATVNGNAVLNWTTVSGATSYNIYSATYQTGPWSLIATSTTNTYTDLNATAAVKKLYRVKAAN